MNDIKYMVKIDQKKMDEAHLGYMFRQTVCGHLFCGRLVNTNGKNFYFEMGEDNALVIIPHDWIEWMGPAKPVKEEIQ